VEENDHSVRKGCVANAASESAAFTWLTVNSVDESVREDIAVHVEAAFNNLVLSAHLDTDVASSKLNTSSHTEVRVHVFQNGAIDDTEQTLAEILQQAHNFPPSVAGALAAPFAVSLADYTSLKLPNDQFNFLDVQNQRDVLAEHARKRFAFLTLLNDISYIRLHPEDFVGADLDKLRGQFAQVTEDINVMEKEASACLRSPGACNFTPFDVSDFPLPVAKVGAKPIPVLVTVGNFVGTNSVDAQVTLFQAHKQDDALDLNPLFIGLFSPPGVPNPIPFVNFRIARQDPAPGSQVPIHSNIVLFEV
jgi:hypothetical protein